MSDVKEWTPGDLSISNVNLKAPQNTLYPSPILDVDDIVNWHVFLTIVKTGDSNSGSALLFARIYDKGEAIILSTLDIISDIPTLASGVAQAVFGRDFPGQKLGLGNLGVHIGMFRMAIKVQFVLNVLSSSNATTCVGSLRVMGQT